MLATRPITEEQVIAALYEVYDPEIPTLSIIDLGIYRGSQITPEGVTVTITPTFAGCPALAVMEERIIERLGEVLLGVPVQVEVSFARPWTSEQISEAGRARLQESGFAPPPRGNLIRLEAVVACPYCGSRKTRLENPFGPTLCRAIYYCTGCRQPFEQFKAV